MMPKTVVFLVLVFLLQKDIPICNSSSGANSKVQILDDGSPYVRLQHGLYFGKTLTSRKGQSYHAFMGIRYAATPKRFERSTPMSDLDMILAPLLAQSLGSSCPQTSEDGLSFVGKEDCLFVNVYVPARDPADEDGFPIIVFIHPGSFKFGSGGTHNAKYFMDENVIYITFNFRLGAVGFFSTGDDALPGNLGLRDQITLLEWTKENVVEFGGNKKRITIAGTESGAASVQYLLLSHVSQGLFQSAIIHGGSALSTFPPNSASHIKEISEKLECPHVPSSLLAECLKTKRLKDLMQIQKIVSAKYLNVSTPFLPSSEQCGNKYKLCSDSFLTKHPAELLSRRQYKRVPLLIGMHSGSLVSRASQNTLIESTIPDSYLPKSGLEKDIIISWLSNIIERVPSFHTNFTSVSEEIQQLYFNTSVHYNDALMIRNSINNFLYDGLVVYGVWKFAVTYARDKPVYPYIITFEGSTTGSTLHGTSTRTNRGFPDGTEFLAPSLPDLHEFEVGSDEEIFSQHLVHLWSTFATHLKPVDVWQNKETWMPLSIAQLNGEKPLMWYALDREVQRIPEPFSKRMKFWDKLFKKETDLFI